MASVEARSSFVRVLVLGLVVGALALVGPARAEEGGERAWTSSAAGLEVTGLSALAMHPKRPDLLYAHVHGLGVARSFDGGATWETLHEGLDPRHLPGPRDAVHIAIDPRDEQILWLTTKGHVYKSENAGERWADVTTGALASYSWDKRASTYCIRGVAVDPNKSLHALAGTRTDGAWHGGLYETEDGGKTWDLIAGSDLPKSELGHDAWPIVLDPRTDKNIAVGGANGVWYSDDRGREFRRVDPGDLGEHDVRDMTPILGRSREIFLADARGLWRSRDGGRRWDKKPLLEGDCVAVGRAPWDRNLLLAVFRDKGVMRSDDGGREWQEIGLADADIREIFAHPREKDVVWFASPTTGLYVSQDEGETIEPVGANVQPVVPAILEVASHPAEPGHLIALGRYGGVWHSVDDALTWSAVGRLTNRSDRLVADAGAAGAWYAVGDGIARSEDHGATWSTTWRPEDAEDRPRALTRLEDGSLIFAMERSRRTAKSPDGKSWTVLKGPGKSADHWVADLAVDPANPKHLLMATRGRQNPWTPKEEEGGPYESYDGGSTWKHLLEGLSDGKKQKLRRWNRGHLALIMPEARLLLYGADGLGLFARRMAGPGDSPPAEPRWIDLGLPLPQPNLGAWALLPGEEEAPAAFVIQIVGENEARELARTTIDAIAARVTAVEEGQEQIEGTLWTSLPDPGATLAAMRADPHVPGRLLGADTEGVQGVLVFGQPGTAKPVTEEPGGAVPDVAAPAGDAPRPPEGLLAFSAGGDGAVRVWDLAAGKPAANLKGHAGEVYAVALAPDESVVATGGADRTVRVFDAANGTLRHTLPPEKTEGVVNAVAFGKDPGHVYLGLEDTWMVLRWDVGTNEVTDYVGHSAAVLCLDVAADGASMVSGSRDRTVRLWNTETQAGTARFDFGAEVLAVALAPDGRRIYAGGRGAAVKVFDVAAGTMIASADVQGQYVTDLVVSPDGALLYVSGDRGVRVVSTADLTPAATPEGGAFQGPQGPVFSLALSADGRWLAGGAAENVLWLWSADRAAPVWSEGGAHAGPVHAIALTPDVTAPGGAAPGGAAPEEGAAEGAADAPAGEGEEGGAGEAAPQR